MLSYSQLKAIEAVLVPAQAVGWADGMWEVQEQLSTLASAAAALQSGMLPDGGVSLQELANLDSKTVIGRTSSGAGVPEAIPVSTTLKADLSLTKSDVGLENVDNTSDANKPVSTAQASADSAVASAASSALSSHSSNNSNPHSVTASQVGLGSVDNTSDANKPVSSATTTALNLKANIASPTFTGTPLSTTASTDTNTTQIATTAFVVGQASSATPLINGSATVGTSLRYAREGHIHPTDTTRLSNSPSFSDVTGSRSFGVDYTPSTTRTVFVMLTLSYAITALQTKTIAILIGGTERARQEASGVLISQNESFSFPVPPNTTYRINNSGTGSASIQRIVEVTL